MVRRCIECNSRIEMSSTKEDASLVCPICGEIKYEDTTYFASKRLLGHVGEKEKKTLINRRRAFLQKESRKRNR